MKNRLMLLIITIIFTASFVSCKGSNSSKQGSGEYNITNNTQTQNNQENDTKNKKYKQSPMLDQKSGLPSIEQRLPKEPKLSNEVPEKIMKPEVGKFGGELRTVTSVIDYDADVFIMNNEALLNTPGLLGETVVPNIVKKYEMSTDEKEFTFYLREGLKWSDGEPVTMEDFKFTFEDFINNKELTPVFPDWLCSEGKVGGTPVKFEVVNDWTFKLSFDKPYGGFLIKLAVSGWRGYEDVLKPAHYLKRFHKKYANPDELEKAIKEAGFKPGEWVNLFNFKDILNNEIQQAGAIGFPGLDPWMLVKIAGNQYTFERNPYYFKVDEAGNQLPYIDRIVSTLVQDIEMVTTKTIAGEVDFSRESAALVKMPLYKQNEKNGYTALLSSMHNMPTNIFLNMTYNNPDWRAIVQDIRFRKALNYSMNRKEIIDTIYYGYAQPSTIIDSTFDLDAGNKLLDEMGMAKGTDGIRKMPNGKEFSIQIEIGAQAPDIQPMTELIVQQWRKLGLNVTMKRIEQTLWNTKNAANDLQATVIWAPVNLWYQANWGQSYWGVLWNTWRTSGGKKGEEPPAYVKEFYNTMTEMMTLPPDKALQKYKGLEDIMKEDIPFFATIKDVRQPLIINSKLGNVTDKGFAIGCNSMAELFYYKK